MSSVVNENHSSGSFKLIQPVNTENTTPLEGTIFDTHKHHSYIYFTQSYNRHWVEMCMTICC